MHPLDLRTNQQVYQLLLDFYIANFTYAGVNDSIPREIIEYTWRSDDGEFTMQQKLRKLFKLAKKQCSNSVVETDPLDQFHHMFLHARSVLDVGANHLDLLWTLGNKFKNIKNFYGIDTKNLDEITLPNSRSQYFKVDSYARNLPQHISDIDVVNIQFVLHHFPDEDSIKRMLEWCASIMSSGGTLLLWEETFQNEFKRSLFEENNAKCVFTHFELTSRFYEFSEEQRWQFIILNDWIINFNNTHMQWTGQYRTWAEWCTLLRTLGFELQVEYNFGLRVNGKLRQGLHVIGTFKKTKI